MTSVEVYVVNEEGQTATEAEYQIDLDDALIPHVGDFIKASDMVDIGRVISRRFNFRTELTSSSYPVPVLSVSLRIKLVENMADYD